MTTQEGSVSCPRCGAAASSLRPLGQMLLQRIQEEKGETPPPEVCDSCYQELAGQTARGAVLLAEAKAREQKKLMVWKSRVALLKKARQLMREKAFADAAISYEKYLRVLETVYEVPSGGLTPEHLKSTARTQELTVVASVYWDLFRIYDTSEKYTERMEKAGKKLVEFLPYTPLLPDILRKAQNFEKTAKKPHLVRTLIKSLTQKKSRCLIATFCYQEDRPDLIYLFQNFRDAVLNQSSWGRAFICWYERNSPRMVQILSKYPQLILPTKLGIYIMSVPLNRWKKKRIQADIEYVLNLEV